MSTYFTVHRCANGWLVRKNQWGGICTNEIAEIHVFNHMKDAAGYMLSSWYDRPAPKPKKK